MIEDSEIRLLSDYSRVAGLSKMVFRSGLGGGRTWTDEISRLAPSLIHAHFLNDGLDAIKLGRRLSLPVIATVHGHDITKHENASKKLRRDFFAKIDCVIGVSKFIAEAALARGCPEHKLELHYIGINLQKFEQQKNESKNPSLLFVGRLVEKKGCTYLLQAMQKLQSKTPELELTVVGDGKLKSVLQQEAQARGLKVEFVGTESAAQVRQRLACCWLFVAPSITATSGDTEGLGMVFLEAQAMRTPVISFRSGGVVEAVDEGTTGLLSDEKDVDALAENISFLLENSSQRHHMGLQGRKRVEQKFDVRKQCAVLEHIYDKLA